MKWQIILVLSAVLACFALRMLQWSPDRLLKKLGVNPILITAQGFGLGRVPYGPGTFGSLGGLIWFALLLIPRSGWLFALGTIAGILFSVWICGRGERILCLKDPASIVMDEIIAVPVCFIFWMWLVTQKTGRIPNSAYFFVTHWPLTLAVLALFRLFDITKPWPVSKSQGLPGGWGVTIDDVLAAGYVNLVCAIVYLLKGFF
jgi:phosphatidylglycerophosphatase A